MRVRFVLLSALVANIALGNLCMAPMAMAEEDTAMMNHDMGAMAAHENQDDSDGQGTPCDSGHCFTHALPSDASFDVTQPAAAALPVSPDIVQTRFEHDRPIATSAAPPGHFFHVDTIVLRN